MTQGKRFRCCLQPSSNQSLCGQESRQVLFHKWVIKCLPCIILAIRITYVSEIQPCIRWEYIHSHCYDGVQSLRIIQVVICPWNRKKSEFLYSASNTGIWTVCSVMIFSCIYNPSLFTLIEYLICSVFHVVCCWIAHL